MSYELEKLPYKSSTKSIIKRVKFVDELAVAFQREVECLLKKFQAQESIRYEDFYNKVWMGSSLRNTFVICQYTYFTKYHELVYGIIRKYYMFSQAAHIQIGALYLLFTLYKANFFGNDVQIRLSIEGYHILEALSRKFSNVYLVVDVGYIFYYLYLKGAFKITGNPYVCNLHTNFWTPPRVFQNDILKNAVTLSTLAKTLFQDDKKFNLKTFEKSIKEYENSYKAVLKKETPGTSTAFRQSTLMSKIKAELDAIQDIVDKSDITEDDLSKRPYNEANSKLGRRNRLKQVLLKDAPHSDSSSD